MFYAMSVLNGIKIQLNKTMKSFNSKSNISDYQEKIKKMRRDYELAAGEVCYLFDQDHSNTRLLQKILKRLKTRFKYALAKTDDNEEFLEAVDDLISSFEEIDVNEYYYTANNKYTFLEDFNSPISGVDFITSLSTKIKGNSSMDVLDLHAYTGERLTPFSGHNTYGVTKLDGCIKELRDNSTRAILANFNEMYCTNNVFDITMIDMLTKRKLSDNMSISKTVYLHERKLLDKAIAYTKKSGITILTIPYYRLYKNTVAHIERGFEIIGIFKGTSESDIDRGLVYIVGRAKSKKQETTEEIDRVYNLQYEEMDTIDSLTESIYIRTEPRNVDVFRSSKFDATEIDFLLSKSNAKNEFYAYTDSSEDNKDMDRPLLPFNLGQIGLVLTSGCLDGEINEGDGYSHMVKGRVSKKTNTKITTEDDTRERVDTITNRVEINILKSDGTFKTLV